MRRRRCNSRFLDDALKIAKPPSHRKCNRQPPADRTSAGRNSNLTSTKPVYQTKHHGWACIRNQPITAGVRRTGGNWLFAVAGPSVVLRLIEGRC
jgi:hypothetical protein